MVELKATQVVHVGECEAATYPIAKKKTSYEFLRRAGWAGAVVCISCAPHQLRGTSHQLRISRTHQWCDTTQSASPGT